MIILHQIYIFSRSSQLFMQRTLYFTHFTGENTETRSFFISMPLLFPLRPSPFLQTSYKLGHYYYIEM